MKKAYLGISFSNRKQFNLEIEELRNILAEKDFELFVFVDHYHFHSHEEKEMMAAAFKEIDNSDLFIAELTTKAIGVGIEIGYAYAKKIPIIYIRKKESEYSTTAAGCAEMKLEYHSMNEIKKTLDFIDKLQ